MASGTCIVSLGPIHVALIAYDEGVVAPDVRPLPDAADAVRRLYELAAKAAIDSLVFEQDTTSDGVVIRAFAKGLRWELQLPDDRLPALSLVAFLNTIGRQLGMDRCFVLDRSDHVTWGRWNAISRGARDGLFAAPLEPTWRCHVNVAERDSAWPPRVSERVLEVVAASDRISLDELVARIVATIVTVLGRRYPGLLFDADFDPSTGLFVPLALADAVESDIGWMRERGAECEVGDELAFRLIPDDIEQAAERWPVLDLATVVSCCDHAIGWALADAFAPDWLRRLPILLVGLD